MAGDSGGLESRGLGPEQSHRFDRFWPGLEGVDLGPGGRAMWLATRVAWRAEASALSSHTGSIDLRLMGSDWNHYIITGSLPPFS